MNGKFGRWVNETLLRRGPVPLYVPFTFGRIELGWFRAIGVNEETGERAPLRRMKGIK